MSVPSPQFSEDMGPASPLIMRGGGGGGGAGEGYHNNVLLQQENEKLRAVVADMRHEMEEMQGRAAAQVAGGGLRGSPKASPYLSGGYLGLGKDRASPLPIPPPVPASQSMEAKLEQMMNENKKLKEDNKKLVGTCVSMSGCVCICTVTD